MSKEYLPYDPDWRPAVGALLDPEVGRLAPGRVSACGLTECAGKPMCPRCVRHAEMDALCALLPEGVHWGDPLTPDLLRELMRHQIPNEFGHLLTPQALRCLYVEDSEPPNAVVTGAQGPALKDEK